MQRNFHNHRLYIARERYWRRCQLWANARLRLGDEKFFANLGAVERSIADTLSQEFPA